LVKLRLSTLIPLWIAMKYESICKGMTSQMLVIDEQIPKDIHDTLIAMGIEAVLA